jgi:hypothetical protein
VSAGTFAAAGGWDENLVGIEARKQRLSALDLKRFFAGIDIELADSVIYQEAFSNHQSGRQKHYQT